MIKKWGKWGLTPLLITLCCVQLSFAKEFKQFTGEINGDNVNLRSDSRVTSELILKLNKGNYVHVVSEAFDWYKIKLPKVAPSYIKKDLVTLLSPRAARVSKDAVNIRLKPTEASAIVGKARRGEVLSVVEDSGDWLRIEPVDSSFGWINKKFVNEITEAQKLAAMAAPVAESAPPEQMASAPGSTVIVEGLVKPYGRVFWRTATHKLIKADKTILFLKGNKKTLEAVTYHKVRVTGKLLEQSNQKYPIIEVERIDSLD